MKVTQLRNDGSENSRFRWITVCAAGELADDGRDVIQGISPKILVNIQGWSDRIRNFVGVSLVQIVIGWMKRAIASLSYS